MTKTRTDVSKTVSNPFRTNALAVGAAAFALLAAALAQPAQAADPFNG